MKKYGAEFIGTFWLVIGEAIYRLIGSTAD